LAGFNPKNVKGFHMVDSEKANF